MGRGMRAKVGLIAVNAITVLDTHDGIDVDATDRARAGRTAVSPGSAARPARPRASLPKLAG
jgi:hypothetical protein